ncbi:endonuclease [Bifidobacterium primatium]|uniref:Endonuclease n=2 Tax=Bifidobacterium TaxID=1678 RepID=A0A2M9H6A8_9BIFI|nr:MULTISPECIES: HNH endonuclease [Bifidobacterium]NEG96000.1 endonuclease [Bifidobacterium sp. SMB2]NEH12465.1 endonuclease [Bifidobacterium saimiriisciurei]PJM72348.1 endonuclease [Bifidobacterium primatium]
MSRNNPRRGKGRAYRRDQLCQRVYQHYDHCYICGRPVDKTRKYPDPWSKTVDETIPVCRGGDPLDWNNVNLAHNWCNRLKGTKSLAWARREAQRLLDGHTPHDSRPTSMPLDTSGDW